MLTDVTVTKNVILIMHSPNARLIFFFERLQYPATNKTSKSI